MEIFRRIKKALDLDNKDVFRRWSASELEEKRQYIENKPPEDFVTEDHYLMAEWLFQRYLPESEEPAPGRWSKTISDIRQKIDANLQKATAVELAKTESVQKELYSITKEDFFKDVVPTLSSFDFLPDPYLKDSKGREIWTVLFELTQPYSYKYGDAKDALILFCDTYLAENLVRDLTRTYIALRNAQQEYSAKVKVICSGKQCEACTAMDGKKLGVEDLLVLFKEGTTLFPHPLKVNGEVSYCPAPYLSPEIGLNEGDDPDFHTWLVKHLE